MPLRYIKLHIMMLSDFSSMNHDGVYLQTCCACVLDCHLSTNRRNLNL